MDYYCNQIVELCKNKPYGTFYEIWQDGAGNINDLTEADYKKWTDTLHKYMPECIVWSTKRSYKQGDVRWVGNEGGVAGDPCWSTVNAADVLAENGIPNTGNPNGDVYMPAETNVSIRPGWFYHPSEQPKSAQTLWNMYFTSVARNTVWLLNFPPDTRGWVPTADSTSGAGLGSLMYGTFRTNLLAGGTATALHTRGTGYEPVKMLDSCESTYFASADAYKTDTIVFVPKASITFDCIMLQEVITLGQRTLNWSVDYTTNGTSWTTVAAANNKQCIGFKRAVQCAQATATQVRLRITNGKACPAIHTFGVFKQTVVTPPSGWNGLGPVTACNAVDVLPGRAADVVLKNVLRIAGDRIALPGGFGAGSVTVKIFDMQGHCVQHIVARGSAFEQQHPLSSLKAGSYLVRCQSGIRTLEQKMVKVH